ncbi:hypothetical protein ABZ436_08440 [Micromonospora matsumotoense]|uniref:hypothetical protein n=1 Tax=Micromonospora matsumotoense TaxID=121616 RepID=UPI003408EEEE
MPKSRARRRADADAEYRRALNLPAGGDLPPQLGATGAGKPSRKPRSKKTAGKTTAEKRRGAGAPPRVKQTAGVAASFAGACGTCGRGYRAGTR